METKLLQALIDLGSKANCKIRLDISEPGIAAEVSTFANGVSKTTKIFMPSGNEKLEELLQKAVSAVQ